MAKSEELAVIVKDLYKSFRLPHEQHSGLKQFLLTLFRRKRQHGYEAQLVLNDISFEIKKGEFFGIVGRNGSGKSTLLKALAGIYTPDSGIVQVNGSLTPFIELGVGFNPELTGRENVYLNGALLGFDHKQMDEMYDDIVSFAELDRFMDQKLKNYSSGMQVRLAFSIAIRAKSDILLIDEVLAVGDQAFQKKCFEYFRELKRQKRTVILVTHDMEAVKNYCTRAMLIDRSEFVAIGSPDDIADEYSLRMIGGGEIVSAEDRPIGDIDVHDASGVKRVVKDGKFNLEISYEAQESLKYFIAYTVKRDGHPITESSSQYNAKLKLGSGRQKVNLTVDASHMTSGEYEIDVAFYDAVTSDIIAYKNSAFTQLVVNDIPEYGGYFAAAASWKS